MLVYRTLNRLLPAYRSLPHIKHSTKHDTTALSSKRSNRCWQFLLLEQTDGEPNEWDIVRAHFEKSRSKKVLTILQQ